MPRISLRAQTLRALADRAAGLEDLLGTTISLVEMSEIEDESHCWHARVTMVGGIGMTQVFRIASPALGDDVARWAKEVYTKWTCELQVGDEWLLLESEALESLFRGTQAPPLRRLSATQS